ncbi:MAG: hypothetical protein WC107_04460 [Patescibacteria group bacterium]
MTEEKIILAESDEAAKFVTGLSGWVDKNGVFWGQLEEMARYASATHKRCEDCKEAIIRRSYRYCVDCIEKKDIERYSKLERKVWDGESYLHSDRDDVYFADYDQLNDYIDEHQIENIDSLRLIICEPEHLRELDADYWADDLPEDTELPDSVLSALETFNASLKDAGVVSWYPGKYAAIIEDK